MSVTCSRAVDAAEVDERTVVGDVLDDAVDDLTLFEVLHQFLALFGAGLFENRTARHDDVAAAAIHLENLERLVDVHQRGDIADRTDVDLRARQERHGAFEVDGEAALDLIEDDAGDLFVGLERLLELAPAFFAARLVARQHGFAERVLDALEIDFDLVADLEFVRAAGTGKFAECDAAFHFQTDVDDRHILFDGDDRAFNNGTFVLSAAAERLIEHGREIFAGWGGGRSCSSSHKLS